MCVLNKYENSSAERGQARDTFSLACFSVKEDSCLKMQLNKEVNRPLEQTIIATILILQYITLKGEKYSVTH